MKTLGMILLSVALSGGGQLLLRAGARTAAGPWWTTLTSAVAVSGLALWCVSTFLWLLVLRHTPLSYAYCLGSLNYIVVPLVSSRLFGEPLDPLRLFGMLLIFCGVLVMIFANFRPAHG